MALSSPARTPFDQGVKSVKTEAAEPSNPFDAGSIEFRNYELGRTFALRQTRSEVSFPLQRPIAK